MDQGDEVGRTPLALAALRGHTDCALTLLNHGASPRSRDTVRGRIPIHLAGITPVCVSQLNNENCSSDTTG